jgi:hypothetical protein
VIVPNFDPWVEGVVVNNPYSKLPDVSFWRRAVANVLPQEVDPVSEVSFTIHPNTEIATAGSCFAQHIARRLCKQGFRYFVAESGPATTGAKD